MGSNHRLFDGREVQADWHFRSENLPSSCHIVSISSLRELGVFRPDQRRHVVIVDGLTMMIERYEKKTQLIVAYFRHGALKAQVVEFMPGNSGRRSKQRNSRERFADGLGNYVGTLYVTENGLRPKRLLARSHKRGQDPQSNLSWRVDTLYVAALSRGRTTPVRSDREAALLAQIRAIGFNKVVDAHPNAAILAWTDPALAEDQGVSPPSQHVESDDGTFRAHAKTDTRLTKNLEAREFVNRVLPEFEKLLSASHRRLPFLTNKRAC